MLLQNLLNIRDIHWIESFFLFARIVLCLKKNMLQKYSQWSMQAYIVFFVQRPFKILQRPSRITVREPCQYKFSLVDRRGARLKIPRVFRDTRSIRNVLANDLVNWHISVNKLFRDWFKNKKKSSKNSF